MSKSRKRKVKKTQNTTPLNITMPSGMSNSEIQALIVSSLLEYDRQKRDLEMREKDAEQKEWLSRIGYKEYSNQRFVPRTFLSLVNLFSSFIQLLFMRKESVRGDYATVSLMRIAILLAFSLTKCILWFVSAVFILSYPCSLVIPSIPNMSFIDALPSIGCGLITLIIAQLFRIASIEIEKMKDRKYLVDIFAAVTAVAAIVISLSLR